jgi:uracil permease
MSKMILDTQELPRSLKEWILYPLQMLLSVFVATVLIATICGTPIDVCLLGGCLGTIIYQLCTGFKSPMFISNSGATVSAVIGALLLGTGVDKVGILGVNYNYLAVAIGGIMIFAVYAIFSLVVKLKGIETFNKIFPATIVGPVTIVIGLNLAKFIPTYVDLTPTISTDPLQWAGVLIAIVVAIIVALMSRYAKGFWKTIPFLIGLLAGFALCLLFEVTGVQDFEIIKKFKEIDSFFHSPHFVLHQWSESPWEWSYLGEIALLFIPVSICALLEHYSDHKVLGNIIDHDLTKDPGLHRTLLGDGLASMIGTWTCGLPNTSYGESVANIGFSKVASVAVTSVAAAVMGCLAFIEPFQVFLKAIPSCVFGGCAIILYGYIASSGLKTIRNGNIDLENNKNLIVISSILTVGVSGVYLFSSSFTGVSLAMVIGVILNLLLRDKKSEVK